MITGGGNRFDRNRIGINHEGTGILTFTGGGSVSNNTEDGIQLGDTGGSTLPLHDLQGFSVAENKVGIRILENASAYIRRVSILNNRVGIIAVYGTNNGFDFGSGVDAGKNVFRTPTLRNNVGAVCVLNTRSTPLKAVGNIFGTCEATMKAIVTIADTACDTLPSDYADFWYAGLSAPDASACSPG